MNEFNVDKTNSQYKGPFNTIISDSNVFTYKDATCKDTTIVMPNSDTPYCAVAGRFTCQAGPLAVAAFQRAFMGRIKIWPG